MTFAPYTTYRRVLLGCVSHKQFRKQQIVDDQTVVNDASDVLTTCVLSAVNNGIFGAMLLYCITKLRDETKFSILTRDCA